MYYGSNPKIQKLLAEVNKEMEMAEISHKAEKRTKALQSAKNTSVNVIVYLIKNKWFWVGLPIIIGVLCLLFGNEEIKGIGFILLFLDLLPLMFVGFLSLGKALRDL